MEEEKEQLRKRIERMQKRVCSCLLLVKGTVFGSDLSAYAYVLFFHHRSINNKLYTRVAHSDYIIWFVSQDIFLIFIT